MKCNGQPLAIATEPDPQNVTPYTSRARNLSLQGAYFVGNLPSLLDIASPSKQTALQQVKTIRMSMQYGEEHQLTGSQASRITYTLESSLDSVNRVEQTAEQMAKKAGIDEDEVFRIAMAVREAAVNAVLHGNSYDPEKRITASFENTGESLVIRIADQGKGLDPETLPDPLAPENLLRGSGRGIFLIRSFMDEVHFKQLHPGTELTLIKHLGTAQTGS
jgi:serine/threonine-protein kinase RsbW